MNPPLPPQRFDLAESTANPRVNARLDCDSLLGELGNPEAPMGLLHLGVKWAGGVDEYRQLYVKAALAIV